MSIATAPRTLSGSPDLAAEVGHIRDLVFVRRLLRERGATEAELQECDAVIGEARQRLAESARLACAEFAPAA
jgi:hypothetical protein